jgi:predicted nucleic-acid-binding protein
VIGVDTNVLVRFLTADDPRQHRTALAFFRERTPADPAYVSAVTLAETAWLLRRRYGLPSEEILESLTMIIDSDDFVVEGREAIESVRVGMGKPDQLTDFVIAQLGRKAGCSQTVTFDRRAAKSVPGMELLT